MAYKDFVNDRNKNILKDVLLFYGAEDFLMEWAAESIVAEYVENEVIQDKLLQYRIDYSQGFLFSKPVPKLPDTEAEQAQNTKTEKKADKGER